MPTANEIIFNVRNLYSEGVSNRDYSFSDRQILYWAKYVRNDLLYKDLKNADIINPQYEQDFGCIKLNKIDQANCTEVKWGENLLTATIPKLLDLKDNAGLTFLGLVDKVTSIPVNVTDGILDDHAPYKRKSGMSAQIIGNRVYIYGNNDLCYINVRGIADDPTTVQSCGIDNVVKCFDFDKDCYPIPSHLEKAMYDMIFTHTMPIILRSLSDKKNDGDNESKA